MLKIKSNTNKFTIIFSEKIGKKKECSKDLVQPLFSSAPLLLFSFFSSCFSVFFLFFCFCFQLPLLKKFSASFWRSSLPPFFSFQLTCALFLSPKIFFFSPKRFCLSPKYFFSSAQNIFDSAQDTFSVQPKNLSLFVVQRLLLFVSFLPAFLFCL